jgi:signal transduction histidine kinase/response regulator RpfG family c-di-GMP phosphodiesterase
MNDWKLCILVCEDYYPEVNAILQKEYPDIACISFSPLCHCPTAEWDDMNNIIQSNLDEGNCLCLLGGRCLQGVQHHLPKLDNLFVYQHNPCAKLIAPDIVEQQQQHGAYVFTAGEVAHCSACLKYCHMTKETLTAYVGTSISQLVVLDTGLVTDVGTHIQTCATHVGLPYSIAPVGLHFLRVFLDNIILTCRLQMERQDSHRAMYSKQQILSDYEMVFDLISDMTHMRSESEVIDSIFNLFAMLYAPGKQAYISLHNGTPGNIRLQPEGLSISDTIHNHMVQLQDEYIWTETGFMLQISHQGEMLGVLYVADFTFSEHRNEYLNLALMLVQVCGLAIKNARNYEELQTTMDELRAAMEQLSKARDAADVANRAKSEFLANMSHEIRTPLNAIIGMTELLLDTPMTSEQKDFVATVYTSGHALLSVVNDILDFSKIEAGKMELESYPFNIRTCLEESLDLVALKADEQRLNLGYIFAEQVPEMVIGDMTRIRQVLFNLLSNAVKFTKTGEVVVKIDLLQDTKPEVPLAQRTGDDGLPHIPNDSSFVVLHIRVQDTGIGIPQHLMYRLFRSFSQVDAATNRKYGGTGLGLAISKRLIEMMQGTIWVESMIDEGSTFHIAFPAKLAPSTDTRPALALYETDQLKNKPILLCSRYVSNRTILRQYTMAWGMVPMVVQSQDEVLATLRQRQDVAGVVVDMHIGPEDPEDPALFLAQVSQLAPPERCAIIAIVPIQQETKLKHTPSVRVDAFLNRPIKPAQFARVLVQYLAKTTPLAAPTAHVSDIQAAQDAYHPPLRILLAEDNMFNQKFALRLLERFGYTADTAVSGLEVLEALQQQQYDVILMDVQMPNMDGLEATRRIREQWIAQQQPYIIAMTANAMTGDREMCLNAGMDDYVSKPVKVQELVNALERASKHTEA